LGSEAKKVSNSVAGALEASERIAEIKPDVIVLITLMVRCTKMQWFLRRMKGWRGVWPGLEPGDKAEL
jgi:hypothetical protein